MNKDQVNSLTIPFKFIVRRKFIKAFLTTLLAISFLVAFLFLPSYGDRVLDVLKAAFLMLAVVIAYVFLFNDILHKSYLEVNHEYIRHRTPYNIRLLYWQEVDDIDVISQNKQKNIVLSRVPKPGKKQSFWRELNKELGGNYYITIPVNSLWGVDADELFTTLRDKLLNVLQQRNAEYITGEATIDEAVNEERSNNYAAAIAKGILSSLTVGILYGFSIVFLGANIILIPLIGVMYISYVYDRNYRAERRSLWRNFILGFVCSLQFPAAYLGIALIGTLEEGDLLLLPIVFGGLVRTVLYDPMEHIIMIILFAGCILWVTFKDVSFRARKQQKQP